MSHPIPNNAAYIAAPDINAEEAQNIAQQQGLGEAILLTRRGTALGWVAAKPSLEPADITAAIRETWTASQPYVLPTHCADKLADHAADIEQAKQLMESIAQGESPADMLEQSPYIERLTPRFEMLSAMTDESDLQEIETIEFDVMDGDEVVAENLWCKASWLSYEDDDASLRFRFSFGMVGYEDVAADKERQNYAGKLTDAFFPESAVITHDHVLEQQLCTSIGIKKLAYVERIIYFNSPNGGAQFHQDVERGHLGVVFAQLRGRTGWLACSKIELMDEMEKFVSDEANLATLQSLMAPEALQQLKTKCANRTELNLWLVDNETNEPAELLLNRCPEFYKQLSDCGYAYIINTGDIILLPQKSLDECCWHTVFCLDDHPGESLSFAIRETD
ncbi:hypothetical protein ACFL2V_09840 [Pseudomonadota bacterium]